MRQTRVSHTHPRRALTLIVVVYVLAALGTLAFALAYRSNAGLHQAKLSLCIRQQDQMALAACEQACRLLASDDPNIDSCDDAWSSWRALERRHRPAGGAPSGQVWWRIVDESGKINVNQTSADILARVKGLDQAVVASIGDWIDGDDIAGPDGAETEYYASLPVGYRCRNAPLECLDELPLIKGIPTERYFGTRPPTSPTDLNDLGSEQVDSAEEEGSAGLCELLTLYGDGKINLNTARPQVLEALPFLSQAAIEEILARQKPGARKFSSVEDINADEAFTETDRLVLRQIGKFASGHFQLQIKSRLEDASFVCEYAAILERKADTVRILTWQRKLPHDLGDPSD